MDLHLKDKIAVVTGASRGIGLATTQALVAEGVTVIAGARTMSPELQHLQDDGYVLFVLVDLSTREGPTALIAKAEDLGGLDILVNNAGAVTPRTDGFTAITDDQWNDSLVLNLMAAVRTTRAAIPQMRRRGGGSIITVSSVNSYLPDPLVLDYSAAKAALSNLSKSLSKELGRHGIRVNTVSPGPVATDLWLGAGGVAKTVAAANNAGAEDVSATAAAQSVTGRFTLPQEVASLVVMLASERIGNVTGSDFVIDGGLTTTI